MNGIGQAAPMRCMPLAALLVLMAACGEPQGSAQEQLRDWVRAGQAAVEAKQRRELVDMISPAYRDVRGNDRGDIENMLRLYFLRQHNIKLLTSVDEITLYGDTAARIELTAGMAGSNDGVLGFSANAYRFVLELERDDGNWRLISASWGELGNDVR